MSYITLARKWRPTKFKELVGQENISHSLKNSIIQDKVSQTYLFSGVRGTGKTSCARILAKALSCTKSEDGEPCNKCKNCQEIIKGYSVDTVEIDAASNRGIDSIRKIRENLHYLPISCKFKIYIIDEAHMLTMESFNALLKSLEEPPEHVKFILATTESKKIPQTIHSRCQSYQFHSIAEDKIKNQLRKIAIVEKIEISDSSLEKIAKTANGALRDALINLDMLLSFCGLKIKDEDLSSILEITDKQDLENLITSIITKDLETSLVTLRKILDKGVPYQVLLNDLIELVCQLSFKLSFSDYNQKNFSISQQLNDLLSKSSLSQFQQYFQILLELEQQLKTSGFISLCFEMTIIKLCSVDSLARVQDIIRYLDQQKPIDSKIKDTSSELSATKQQTEVVEKTELLDTKQQTEDIEKTELLATKQQDEVIEKTELLATKQQTEVIEKTELLATKQQDEVIEKTELLDTKQQDEVIEKTELLATKQQTEVIAQQSNEILTNKSNLEYKAEIYLESYNSFLASLENKLPISVLYSLKKLKFISFKDKLLTLKTDNGLSFFTQNYQNSLKEKLESFFGYEIKLDLQGLNNGIAEINNPLVTVAKQVFPDAKITLK